MSQEPMVRPMKREDFASIVAIDSSITQEDRSGYYERKMRVLDDADAVNMCLVAEADGRVVGFVMGDLYTGEYGIPEATAVVDTIGVSPDFQDRGLGTSLFSRFRSNLKALNVSKRRIEARGRGAASVELKDVVVISFVRTPFEAFGGGFKFTPVWELVRPPSASPSAG